MNLRANSPNLRVTTPLSPSRLSNLAFPKLLSLYATSARLCVIIFVLPNQMTATSKVNALNYPYKLREPPRNLTESPRYNPFITLASFQLSIPQKLLSLCATSARLCVIIFVLPIQMTATSKVTANNYPYKLREPPRKLSESPRYNPFITLAPFQLSIPQNSCHSAPPLQDSVS